MTGAARQINADPRYNSLTDITFVTLIIQEKVSSQKETICMRLDVVFGLFVLLFSVGPHKDIRNDKWNGETLTLSG